MGACTKIGTGVKKKTLEEIKLLGINFMLLDLRFIISA